MNRILRFNEVRQITGLSKTVLYEMIKNGQFPKGLRLTKRTVGWLESDVIEWINEVVKKNRGVSK